MTEIMLIVFHPYIHCQKGIFYFLLYDIYVGLKNNFMERRIISANVISSLWNECVRNWQQCYNLNKFQLCMLVNYSLLKCIRNSFSLLLF